MAGNEEPAQRPPLEAPDAESGCLFGGTYTIVVECDQVCITAASLYGIYKASRLIERAIDGIMFRKWLGGTTIDQTILEIRQGFQLVKLQCYTDERFMEVWEDFKSGELKKRLLEEFSTCDIEVKGLKIDIKNLEEVNEKRKQIKSRKIMAKPEIPRRLSPLANPVPVMQERRISPGIIVQGGAYSLMINLRRLYKEEFMEGIKQAAKNGYAVLMQVGKTAVDAVEEAVRFLENHGDFNAGRGSHPNRNGEVECDSMIMNGNTMETGAVMAVRHFANPVSLSREVMEKTPHCAMCAEGALIFAREINFPICDPEDLTYETRPPVRIDSDQRYKEFVERYFGGNVVPDAHSDLSSDSVSAVAIDVNGHLACATSTGGIRGKKKGRIGDAPLVGCGGYANEFGAATSTGHGEALMKMTLARDVVFNIENGLNAQESAERSVRRMQERIQGFGGIIVIDKDGNFGKAFNTEVMTWASVKDDELNYGMDRDECITENV